MDDDEMVDEEDEGAGEDDEEVGQHALVPYYTSYAYAYQYKAFIGTTCVTNTWHCVPKACT